METNNDFNNEIENLATQNADENPVAQLAIAPQVQESTVLGMPDTFAYGAGATVGLGGLIYAGFKIYDWASAPDEEETSGKTNKNGKTNKKTDSEKK